MNPLCLVGFDGGEQGPQQSSCFTAEFPGPGKKGYMGGVLVWNLSCVFILVPCVMLSANRDVALV